MLPKTITRSSEGKDDTAFTYLLTNPVPVPELTGLVVKQVNSPATTEYKALTLCDVLGVPRVAPDNAYIASVTCRVRTYSGAALDQISAAETRTTVIIGDLRRKILGFAAFVRNWDGEAAEAISITSITTSLRLLDHIGIVLSRRNVSSSPSVQPHPDGSIFFKWIQGQKELAITVLDKHLEAQRWHPLDAYRSDGLWEISVDDAAEFIEWVLN